MDVETGDPWNPVGQESLEDAVWMTEDPDSNEVRCKV